MNHDVEPGPLNHCQITGSTNLHEIIDLGYQPPCDALLDVPGEAKSHPLKLMLCPDSGLAQLSHVVDGAEIYPPSYPYRSGISKPLADYQKAFADGVVGRFGVGLAVDIGSNDGTLLTGFARNLCPVMGVEPTDVAKIAREENGIRTIQAFFTEEVARSIGKARFVTMTNVFAHMAPLGEVMRGVCALLADDGVFITESHYLLDVRDGYQFDTIYHEHIRTYSLKSIMVLVEQYGLEVFDVERKDRYGGNIRAYIGWEGKHPVSDSVLALLKMEEDSRLYDPESWWDFAANSEAAADALYDFLYTMKVKGKRVAGVSAPGRCTVLLNFAGITPDLLPYLGELHNSLKLGKYVPGCNIPIVHNKRIIEEQPDAVVLMAWHYAEPIIKRLRQEGYKGEIYSPLPSFRCVSDPEWYPCVSAS